MALAQVLHILLLLLLAVQIPQARALQDLTETIFITALIAQPSSLSAPETSFRGPRRRAGGSLSINPCASSCFNSAVTKSTNVRYRGLGMRVRSGE